MTNRHKALLELGERLADDYWAVLNQGVGTQHATTLYKQGFAEAVELLLPIIETFAGYGVGCIFAGDKMLSDLDTRLQLNKGDRE